MRPGIIRLGFISAAVRPVTLINELAGGWSSYRRRVEVLEIHFNEILDSSQGKDDGSFPNLPFILSPTPPSPSPFIVPAFS